MPLHWSGVDADMGQGCFFIGHRDSPSDIKTQLVEAINKHIIEYGVTEFYVGNHGSFDFMAASALGQVKQTHPQVCSYMVLAYHPSIRKPELPTGFDGFLFPEGQELCPPKYAIPTLNRLMIQQANYLITYIRRITNGSYKLMQYARNREKQGRLIITNLANSQP